MIKNGTKPLIKYPRRLFHETFGSTAPSTIPDFNLDRGLWNPNQAADGAPTECVGYLNADIITDLTGTVRSPDWHYAAAFLIEGVTPSTAGVDFHAGMQASVAVGSLSMMAAGSYTAKNQGELQVANWANWSAQEKALALQTTQVGTLDATGNGAPFDSIRSACYTSKVGISVGTPWFPEFEGVGADGILPMPSTANLALATSTPSAFPWHNHNMKGQKTIDQPYIVDKSWQGEGYGDHGFCYFSRELVNAIMLIPGTGAITFALTGSRMAAILGILIDRFPALLNDPAALVAILNA